MLVYRICKKSELERIFEDTNFTSVGYNFPVFDLNIHNYTENSKYLHFFLKKESIFYLRTLKDRYICIYDIPEDILNRYDERIYSRLSNKMLALNIPFTGIDMRKRF